MNIVFMSMDTLPSTLWARDLYDQMHIRSDFRKWFPRMCQYGFIEGRDYEYMPRVRLQDEGGRTVQRYVKDYRITQDMAKKLCKLHHTAVGAAYHHDSAETTLKRVVIWKESFHSWVCVSSPSTIIMTVQRKTMIRVVF